ncbi:MAG: nodulation protein NfeD [Chloroflexi bacterium]|nr:nodulation protein NfeD [Chloroflexota bacterium]
MIRGGCIITPMERLAIARVMLLGVLIGLGLVGTVSPAHAQGPENQVYILTVDGAIDPISERYISRGIGKAEKDGARLLVIRLDTPGGLLSSTFKIVERLLGARVPTVVYVYPAGALAASAGTFVTVAANFAVMAEGTSIGAASPVGAGGEDLPETLSEKAINITVALMEGIAEKRDRNKDLLVSTVTEAKAFTASVAVEQNIVDFIATDMDDLLTKLDGRVAQTAAGEVVIETEGLVKREIGMNAAERFFSFVANPNIIGILLTIGGLGILIELLHPGLIVPGVGGVLAMIVGLVALGTLPFNWAGVALLIVAAVLIFLEMQVPGLGVLGLGGVIAFIIGSLLLFSVGEPSFPGAPVLKISLWLLGILSAMMALFTLVVVTAVARSRRLKYVSALAELVGQRGRVTSDLDPTGTVQVASEMWSAVSQSEEVISQGEEIEVVEVSGLVLKVRKG